MFKELIQKVNPFRSNTQVLKLSDCILEKKSLVKDAVYDF